MRRFFARCITFALVVGSLTACSDDTARKEAGKQRELDRLTNGTRVLDTLKPIKKPDSGKEK